MKSIGIIGAGIAGLHLGLFLRQHGIAATIYTEKTPEQLRASRLANIVVRFAPTRERECLLGVNHWDSAETDLFGISYYIGGDRPIAFTGDLPQPANVVDMRIYCARLLEDFAMRGGHVAIGTLHASDVERLAAEHDLMVVAAGRGSLANMFPRLPEHSPYSQPQRLTVGGFYRGITNPQPLVFSTNITPRHGEIFVAPLFSFEPHLTGIGIEIVAGGAFEILRHLRYEEEPHSFDAAVLSLLREYAPAVYDRVDPKAFGLSGALNLCHAAITPTVRRGYIQLPNSKFAMALGDAHVVIDPVTGQGANTASHSAWVLGQAIRDCRSFDQAFCQQAEQQICSYALPVSEACNARFGPPQPHTGQLMARAPHNKAIADLFTDGANHPDRLWAIMSSPERTAAFLGQFSSQDMPVVAEAA
jgi:hypothetical protein